MSPLPGTFQLKLPEGWEEMPLDPAAVRRRLDDAATAAATAGRPLDGAELDRLAALAGKAAVEASDQGVVFVAGYAEPLTEDGTTMVLAATVAVASRRAAEVGRSRGAVTAPLLAAAFGDPREGARLVRPAATVALPAGEAVEVVAVERPTGDGLPGPEELFSCTYLVPVGAGDGLVVLAFRTPNLSLADDFEALFRSIAETLELS